MEGLAPILAVCLLVGQEMDRYRRFPPERVCGKNFGIAQQYTQELSSHAEIVGGWPAIGFREREREARRLQNLWLALWWVSWDTDLDTKEYWAEHARDLVGDWSYFSGQWPGPLPIWHFDIISDCGRR